MYDAPPNTDRLETLEQHLPPPTRLQKTSLDARKKRGLIAGAAFGYAQAIIFWVFALLFYVGAILVDDGTLDFLDFFTAMFAVIFGAFGVGQISADTGDAGEGEQAAAKIFLLNGALRDCREWQDTTVLTII